MLCLACCVTVTWSLREILNLRVTCESLCACSRHMPCLCITVICMSGRADLLWMVVAGPHGLSVALLQAKGARAAQPPAPAACGHQSAGHAPQAGSAGCLPGLPAARCRGQGARAPSQGEQALSLCCDCTLRPTIALQGPLPRYCSLASGQLTCLQDQRLAQNCRLTSLQHQAMLLLEQFVSSLHAAYDLVSVCASVFKRGALHKRHCTYC